MGVISGCTAALNVNECAAAAIAGAGWIGAATMAPTVAAAIPADRYERIETSITTPEFPYRPVPTSSVSPRSTLQLPGQSWLKTQTGGDRDLCSPTASR